MLSYKNNILHIEDIRVDEIAMQLGTPLYIYSQNKIISNITRYKDAFKKFSPLICYAVKASSNLHLLNLIQQEGCGFDCVSEGEARRVLHNKADPQKVIISGVGKTNQEIEFCLKNNILLINAESPEELHRINQIAKRIGVTASVGLRVNPDIDSKTHEKIRTGTSDDKFGIDLDYILSNISKFKFFSNLEIKSLSCHIGSQITDISPYEHSYKKMAQLAQFFLKKNFPLQFIDLGGGVGISYNEEQTIELSDLASLYQKYLSKFGLQLILEPGRSIVGDAGILLSQIVEIKNLHKPAPFIVLDAGMNDILRPAIYGASHKILSVKKAANDKTYNIAGPICESSDIYARNYLLPLQTVGEYLVIRDAGAYCASMSSNYNTRPLASEALVHDKRHYMLIRKRQSFKDIFQSELI